MTLHTPQEKAFTLHQLVAMSTMLSPTHGTHLRPVILGGGGDAHSQVAEHHLYLSDAIQDHLREVYDGLRKPDPQLPRERLKEWLETEQYQPIENLEKESYTCAQFMEAVYFNHGFEVTKAIRSEDKDISRPLSNYFISSSHNTYLSGNQLSSKSSTEAYKNVLIRGCRCIEIDVHNGELPTTATSETTSPGMPQISSSPKPEHKRHISGTTLAEALEKAEATYASTKKKVMEKTGLGVNFLSIDDHSKSNDNLSIGNSIERPPSQRSMRVGEPLVLHGWTLTTPVGFRAVCKSIRETAFLTSNFPIIVSLEVHADLEQQEVMVNIMKEEWDGLLVEQAHEACNPDERLPTLKEMLNKILIKVKKADQAKLKPVSTSSSLAPAPTLHDGDSGASSDDERSAAKKKAKKGICKNLSDLGIYTHSEHFMTFESPSASNPSHIFSIEERTIMELHEKKKSEMFTHNRNFFMRAYPAGFRIDSSNLDPSVFWRKGVQMVALNWQNLDEGVMLNEGMFAGEQGWVLKPSGYRSDPTEPIQYKTLDLKITVFAGQHIPLSPHQTEKGFHPYIRCELHVEKQEERTGQPIEGGGRAKEGEHKRRTPSGKGDHPDFGREGSLMDFSGIGKVVEELSFVRFKVEDAKYAKDSLAAWACIRLDRLQQGYRFVRLLDSKGVASDGLLLVKIEKSLRLLGEGTPHPTTPALMPNLTHWMTAPALVGGMKPLQRVDCGLDGRR